MIDTDKYEGHSKEWTLNYNDWAWATSMFTAAGETNEADALLVIDAPLILEAYKQLRELLVKGSDDYTTSYMDLREIIEDVYWALIGDDVHYSESDGARIKYALGILSVVIG